VQYNVTYACGHEGTVQLYGKRSEREWKLAREEEKLCPDCWKAERDEKRKQKNAEAAEANAAAGLPPLEGTEAQVLWAESIRQEALKFIHDYYTGDPYGLDDFDDYLKGLESIKQRVSASWWIDNRQVFYNVDRTGDLLLEEAKRAKLEESAPPAEIVEQAKAEATVYPEKRVTDLVVEISVSDNEVSAYLPERSDVFREIVKGLGYDWGSGRWRKPIKVTNGPASDRAAELGNKLLVAGFPVRIYDPEIRQKAVSGEYEPECKRWVFVTNEKHKRPGCLAIWWSRQEGDFYGTAKRIAGAAWDRPYVIVPPENYEEVLDFAQMYGFQVSEAAKKAIETAKAMKARALVPNTPSKPKEVIPSGKPPVLEVPDEVEIDDEFRDEN
jgi:hypothetical protein